MTISDKDRSLLNLLGFSIVALCVIILFFTGSSTSVPEINASSVSVIRVPESFGDTVSVSIDGSWAVILFENGIIRTSFLRSNQPFKIIWEES